MTTDPFFTTLLVLSIGILSLLVLPWTRAEVESSRRGWATLFVLPRRALEHVRTTRSPLRPHPRMGSGTPLSTKAGLG